ncbi:uncharacterized protein L3040_005115 [Drepanopeziza brunnea f. sp. 'multigermtubi']|uniref:uncharacterized protein n=1 Tax=Drepanopeziza brunnea f. sp. 'multigermtubi' TaxID=698441 RepID=UPI00238DAF16|nr:hypothetical protein L3040_005115 [Drepanopeziza brunnea f. sp. 'multigermtubi']
MVRSSSLLSGSFLTNRKGWSGFQKAANTLQSTGNGRSISIHKAAHACELTEMASSDPGRQPLSLPFINPNIHQPQLQVLEALTTFLIFKGRVIAAANLQEAPALACFNQLTSSITCNGQQEAASLPRPLAMTSKRPQINRTLGSSSSFFETPSSTSSFEQETIIRAKTMPLFGKLPKQPLLCRPLQAARALWNGRSVLAPVPEALLKLDRDWGQANVFA